MMYSEATVQVMQPLIASIMDDFGENSTYLEEKSDIYISNKKRFCNVYKEVDIAERFKSIQDTIMQQEIPFLTKLLDETPFDTGYESAAERYYNDLSKNYGVIAESILINIYLQNMYDKQHLLKHLLFIVANQSKARRRNLELIPLAGIGNPDIEIQDLSVKCLESWGDKRHLPTLRELCCKTEVKWFKEYLQDVIRELDEG